MLQKLRKMKLWLGVALAFSLVAAVACGADDPATPVPAPVVSAAEIGAMVQQAVAAAPPRRPRRRE